MGRDVGTLAVPLGFSSENRSLSTDLPLFKAAKLKPLEWHRKCSSEARLSFSLITAKINKHTWESRMTWPGKFCRDFGGTRSSFGAELAAAVVWG